MQIPRQNHPRFGFSCLGQGPGTCHFFKSPRGSDAQPVGRPTTLEGVGLGKWRLLHPASEITANQHVLSTTSIAVLGCSLRVTYLTSALLQKPQDLDSTVSWHKKGN